MRILLLSQVAIATQEIERTKQNQKDEWRRFALPLIFLVLCLKQNLHCYKVETLAKLNLESEPATTSDQEIKELYQFTKVWQHFCKLKPKPCKGFKSTKWRSHLVLWYYVIGSGTNFRLRH